MSRRYQVTGGGGVAYSSGGSTVNVIPKNDGAGGLKDSALTDNATNVISTEAFLAPAGTTSLPPYSFSAGSANGLMMSGNSLGMIASNGALGWWTVGPNAGGVQTGSTTQIGWNSGTTIFGGSIDTAFSRVAAASIRQGLANSASPIAQTFTLGESSRGGTDSNVAGAIGTIGPGIGTGTGAGSALIINRNIMGATGTTAQTRTNAFAVGQSKTLSNTSATAQTIATITLGSNAGGGCSGAFTIVATDGTNFDAETQSFNVSFVNKAGAITVGSVVVTATTAANNSGSATLGITAVANGNNIDIKVTPVFTTIVPTTVTLYPDITHCTGNITFS